MAIEHSHRHTHTHTLMEPHICLILTAVYCKTISYAYMWCVQFFRIGFNVYIYIFTYMHICNTTTYHDILQYQKACKQITMICRKYMYTERVCTLAHQQPFWLCQSFSAGQSNVAASAVEHSRRPGGFHLGVSNPWGYLQAYMHRLYACYHSPVSSSQKGRSTAAW